jgi:hypothetical protein
MNIYNNGTTTLTAGDIERMQQRIAELEQKNAELVAQVAELNKLHSDLTNADMICDEDENHIGYVIENDQIDEMERLLSVDTQCLNQIKAEAVLKFAQEFNDSGWIQESMWTIEKYAERILKDAK